MALRQYDVVKRIPFPPNPSGYYYWASTYYYDTDDFGSPGLAGARAVNVDKIHTLDVVQYVQEVVKQPPGRGNVLLTINLLLQPGSIVSGGAEYSLLDVGRLTTIYNDGRTSYRYWRAPMLRSWYTPDAFGAFATARMSSYINNLRAVAGFPASRNVYGGVMVGGVVPVAPTMWQLRHGTHRRERVY